jgi:diaminohydroxyphosphoribosylaminopyrimidine deaminase/5-amino-6-(5-phosphoribosylamino)uracil reductase
MSTQPGISSTSNGTDAEQAVDAWRSNTNRFSFEDFQWMGRAVRLASRGRYTTRANPQVGCVLVRDGQLVGEGFTSPPGQAHAEVNALADANGRARGATAYVTLEPCAHFGRTPPCADALIEAGVSRVVVANVDPNPQVAGRSVLRLREAGIICDVGLLSGPAARRNAAFFKRQRTGLPWVRVKLAMSLDGHTGLTNGDSRWLSGEAARLDVQQWRACACAILSGADTVLADDPSLTVRINQAGHCVGEHTTDIPQPLRVIVDGRQRLTPALRTLTLPGKVTIATSPDAPPGWCESMRAAGAGILKTQTGAAGHIVLKTLLAALGAQEINLVHTECGPQLAGALLEEGLVDELMVYACGSLLDATANPLLRLTPIASMEERRHLRLLETRRIGADLRLRFSPGQAPDVTPSSAT